MAIVPGWTSQRRADLVLTYNMFKLKNAFDLSVQSNAKLKLLILEHIFRTVYLLAIISQESRGLVYRDGGKNRDTSHHVSFKVGPTKGQTQVRPRKNSGPKEEFK